MQLALSRISVVFLTLLAKSNELSQQGWAIFLMFLCETYLPFWDTKPIVGEYIALPCPKTFSSLFCEQPHSTNAMVRTSAVGSHFVKLMHRRGKKKRFRLKSVQSPRKLSNAITDLPCFPKAGFARYSQNLELYLSTAASAFCTPPQDLLFPIQRVQTSYTMSIPHHQPL